MVATDSISIHAPFHPGLSRGAGYAILGENWETGGNAMEIRPGRYRHFKGKEYQVLGVAVHSETLEPMVVYRALYGEGGLWVRPASMWSEQVERDGYSGPRFRWIGP